jgi:DNA-binding NtrC family response regulator
MRVLMVRDEAEHWHGLRTALETEPFSLSEVRRVSDADQQLRSPNPPQLIFTAVLLADGGWEKVLTLGKREGIPVIVVSASADVHFYVDTLERGAFDYVVPPFRREDIAYLVHNATWRNKEKSNESFYCAA